jgi:hypothetical protein
MDDKRLDRLLTYTVFHIGVYMSLTTAFMGATVFGSLYHPVLRWAVGCFLVAGACGGVIAANIAEFKGSPEEFFAKGALNFWKKWRLTYRWLASIEHAAFWVGLLPVALVFLSCGGAAFKKS